MSDSKITGEDLLIRCQQTPNPYALKFVVNTVLRTEGKVTFNSQDECVSLPLVYSLFDIDGVRQVYLFRNTLTLSHEGHIDNESLKENVFSVLRTRIAVHDPAFQAPQVKTEVSKKPVDRSKLSPELQSIEEILDRTIRPGLQADGGDLEVLEFKNDEIKIMYQGACGGCPSAMMGTLDAIQSILRAELQNDELIVVPI